MKTESRQDDIAILLANRTYLYRLLQNLFGNEPALETIQILNNDHTQTSLTLLSLEDSLDLVRDFTEQLEKNKDAALDEVRTEYTRLFLGPTKLPAPPWESVYVSKERLLFQESTLEVRRCYLKYNYLPARYRFEADDHLALELDFMYNLSNLAEAAFQGEDLSEFREILKDQKIFLAEHLLVWVPQFAFDLESATTHSFYRGIVSLLKKYLKTDIEVIDEMLASL
ncbi:TorD/DmsD family molecular chaperone [Desulfosporosinus hippei]|uniref:Chaperone TorD involved in molybdoenzyme TorA maturation n=1 Tax=Desulfosporosinus hippei DSM 8344 TaxID=1121419 RepID=A0A1G7Z9M6_9FIRM|nr:molecular chaperone TorD family protein [Desulfosporosinus hippei]SDH05443.1 chaperone TorD involved in molybdoenzyme TorA maturation [Desulfosporosinus hippei DSM 8344]